MRRIVASFDRIGLCCICGRVATGCGYAQRAASGRSGGVLTAQESPARPDCLRHGVLKPHGGRRPFLGVVILRRSFGAIAYFSRRNCRER